MANWDKGMTGNAGIFAAAHALTIAGYNVLLTNRNMEGPDLIAIAGSGATHQIQVKAHKAAVQDISLKIGIDRPSLRDPNWIFVRNAMSNSPLLYILNRHQLTEFIGQDPGVRSGKNSDQRQWWIGIRKPISKGLLDHAINNFENLI